MASAQVKSCLLLAGLYAEGITRVIEPAPTRDHTERMLEGFGYPLAREGDRTVAITGGGTLLGTAIDVPADISSAAFFLVGASIGPGSELLLEHVGINPTRTGVIDILRLMGADIGVEPRLAGGSRWPICECATHRCMASKSPGFGAVGHDEFPALFIAAACAEGITVLTGAEELRVGKRPNSGDGRRFDGTGHRRWADHGRYRHSGRHAVWRHGR